MIQSKGIRFDNFYIPPFTVSEGEILIIQLPNGYYYFTGLLFKLVDTLTGKEKDKNVELKKVLKYVEQLSENRLKNIFYPLTVKRYIKRHANPDNELAKRIYEFDEIEPNTRITRLPGNSRKLLSLLITFSWTDKIVFDLAGVDPMGGQRAYELVKNQIGRSGAAILIDSCDDFENDCSKFIKFEIINLKPETKKATSINR